MPEVLVIRLRDLSNSIAQAQWLLVDTTGTRLGSVIEGVLADAAALASSHKTIVLAPGTEVLLAEPVLPVKGGARLAQVVPFALEEQLAGDVEDMHFAVGKREGRPGTPVATLASEKLDAWLAALAAAQIVVATVYPETAVMPEAANGLTLMIENKTIYVRRPGVPPAALDVEPLIEGLQLALSSGSEEREHVTVYITPDDYDREQELIEGLREFTASLQVKLIPEGPLPLLAVNAASQGAINLLQGPYAVKSTFKLGLGPWKYAAMLAGAFIVMQLGIKGAQLGHLKREETNLDTEIKSLYAQALPGSLPVAPEEARRRFEARLIEVRRGGQVSALMQGLSTLSAALEQAPDTRIDALSYRTNVLDLRVTAPNVDVLDKIQRVSQERGVSAQIQSASPRESKIEGRLQLKTSGV
jgi:general secretion pathway protein L